MQQVIFMKKEEIDKENMHDVIKHFPEQVIKGFKLGAGIKVVDKIEGILITGMGGSALPGEILKSYLHDSKIPITINRDYFIPEWVNSKTLVFAISFSGNTEETINAYRNAIRKGCNVIAVSSGGKLKMLADKQKVPHIMIPGGIQPRSGYGFLFFSILRVLQNSNLIEDQTSFVEKTVATLQKPIFWERAKELAEKLKDKIPVIYSSDRLKAIAYKWKISFNENSKVHAFYNVFPELNHNEMVGYTNVKGNLYIIIIKDEDDYERTRARMKLTKDLIKKAGVPVVEIELSGPCRLAKLISAIYIGDWTSYYLAMEYGLDPTPVDIIEEFKKKL